MTDLSPTFLLASNIQLSEEPEKPFTDYFYQPGVDTSRLFPVLSPSFHLLVPLLHRPKQDPAPAVPRAPRSHTAAWVRHARRLLSELKTNRRSQAAKLRKLIQRGEKAHTNPSVTAEPLSERKQANVHLLYKVETTSLDIGIRARGFFQSFEHPAGSLGWPMFMFWGDSKVTRPSICVHLCV